MVQKSFDVLNKVFRLFIEARKTLEVCSLFFSSLKRFLNIQFIHSKTQSFQKLFI